MDVSELYKRVKDLELVVASLMKEIEALKKIEKPTYQQPYFQPTITPGIGTTQIQQCYICQQWYPIGGHHSCYESIYTSGTIGSSYPVSSII